MNRAPVAPSTTNTLRVGLLADPAAPTKIARRISNLGRHVARVARPGTSR